MMGQLELLNREWDVAKREFLANRDGRPYYDEKKDSDIKNQYYQNISFADSNLLDGLHALLEKTHINQLDYSPHRYVYPWVDLQENGGLKSLYSGKSKDPLAAIAEDIQLHEARLKGLISSFSGTDLLNCEHVVPQSWFNKEDPMRGDLHHLFSCEPNCNSKRSNYPYHDFHEYKPEGQIQSIKEGCGKSENGKFEPEYGKGIVSRATLYFLVRYPSKVKNDLVNIPLLQEWHLTFPVSTYEKHRNLAIYELQGNRNPFIDFPEMAEKMVIKRS